MSKLWQFLMTLAVNAVPALGWLVGDWSSGTTLVVYWFETVAASLFIALRVILHRRVHPCRGHFRYEGAKDAQHSGSRSTGTGSFLENFLPVTLIFSAGHAVFLFAFIFILTHNGHGAEMGLNWQEVLKGCGLVLLFLILYLVVDIFTMRQRPFRWVEMLATRNLGRIFVVHLTLIFGMMVAGMMGGARGFFLVFVILKTLYDLGNVVPQYDPAEAPKWLCFLMDRVPNISGKKGGPKTFAEFWVVGKRDEVMRLKRNEEPMERPR